MNNNFTSPDFYQIDDLLSEGREASVTDLKNYSNDLDFTVEEIKAQLKLIN